MERGNRTGRNMDHMDQSEQMNAPQRGDGTDLPSINADRTPPSKNPFVNEASEHTYGATESEVSRDDDVIAPTFSDTEPGAGTNYGAAGNPDAPNLGGLEDQTTLGPYSVRPPDRQLVHPGEFETRPAGGDAATGTGNVADGGTPSMTSAGAAPVPGAGKVEPHRQLTMDAPAAPADYESAGASRENPLAAPAGASPQIPGSPGTTAAPGHGNNLGGEGAYAPRPLPGEATQGVASFTNPTTDRINKENRPGNLPSGQVTYGNPQVYGDDQIGRFGTSSGSQGELPGGRMIDLAHGGAAEQPLRVDPDFPNVAPTALDAAEPVRPAQPGDANAAQPDATDQSTLMP